MHNLNKKYFPTVLHIYNIVQITLKNILKSTIHNITKLINIRITSFIEKHKI